MTLSKAQKLCNNQFLTEFENLFYYNQPKQNIALTRNMLVSESRGVWIAFIDDDEVADVNWLKAYLNIKDRVDGDGFFGPVLSVFEEEPPSWLDKEIFFKRKIIFNWCKNS